MPRVDDVTLLAILVREALRRVKVDLLLDHVALKAALDDVLNESEVRVFMQSTRPIAIAIDDPPAPPVDPLFAASEALKRRGR